MGYRVYVQRDRPSIDVPAISRNARQHFGARVETVPLTDESTPEPTRVSLRLLRSDGVEGVFALTARLATDADWRSAREAEVRGRAAGMGDLAARCRTLWELEPEPGTPESATLTLCAALAVTALGPVLPPDGSTLFGVRGAMQRAERLARDDA